MKEDKKFYTDREEKANYLTHAFGVFMAVIATIVLLRKAIVADNGWAIIAYTIFAFGMLACMLSSTIYHFVQVPKAKAILRHFDHQFRPNRFSKPVRSSFCAKHCYRQK